ncbi:MAG: MBL fold metallo-hydrolase, partial [Eubacteriales bacterium]
TAASEGLPALFCQCPVCTAARRNMGREFRGRAGICVNGKLLVDFPPDIYYGAARAGVDLSQIEDIVVTHSHEDHFDAYELSTRREPVYCRRETSGVLHVYGNMSTASRLKEYVATDENGHGENHGLVFDYAPSFEPIETAADVTVYPLPADHDRHQECRMMLLVEQSTGKTFLYAHDTGLFPEETVEFLKGKRCDLISLDCTNVMLGDEKDRNHMGIRADLRMKRLLLENGTADAKTVFVCHHFSHNGFITADRVYTQQEFERLAAEQGFRMAYDGMKLEL